jgi:hypothetical protein
MLRNTHAVLTAICVDNLMTQFVKGLITETTRRFEFYNDNLGAMYKFNPSLAAGLGALYTECI